MRCRTDIRRELTGISSVALNKVSVRVWTITFAHLRFDGTTGPRQQPTSIPAPSGVTI